MGRLLLVLAITAGLAFPGTVRSVPLSERAPGKFEIAQASGSSAGQPFVNSRYVIWADSKKVKGKGCVLSYDLLTKETAIISQENGWVEMRNWNCIFLGTSHCCWIQTLGGGPNAWNLLGGTVYAPSGMLLTDGFPATKQANIHERYVAFNQVLKGQEETYFIDLSKPEVEKKLLTSKPNYQFVPTVSHKKVAYTQINDDKKSEIFVYDILKDESYKISKDGTNNSNPIITKNYVYYVEVGRNTETIQCYNIETKETKPIKFGVKYSGLFLVNNPDTNMLVIKTSAGIKYSKDCIICYDPALDKVIDVTASLSDGLPGRIEFASGCCHCRRIVYSIDYSVMMSEIDEKGNVQTKTINTSFIRKTNARIFCNTIVWQERDQNTGLVHIYGYVIE